MQCVPITLQPIEHFVRLNEFHMKYRGICSPQAPRIQRLVRRMALQNVNEIAMNAQATLDACIA